MRMLETQDDFESMWQCKGEPIDGMRKSDKTFLVYFTATWCGYCRRIDLAQVDKVATAK